MNWRTKALQHAKEEDPKESVGLLLNIKGKKIYYPCRNLVDDSSLYSQQCFILDPQDYVKAEDLGQVIGVVHSHPITPAIASEADKVSCEAGSLPWYIVNPKTEQWGQYEPTGYKLPLRGRSWCWGVTDCWSLVRDFYKEELGITLRDWERPITPEKFLENPTFEKCTEATGFYLLKPDEKLENGDLLLMSIMSKGLNHAAIFLDGEVLHHLAERLSCQEPYTEWLLKCTGGKYRYAQND